MAASMNRREFISSAAAACSVLTGGALLAGCSANTAGQTNAPQTEVSDNIEFSSEETCDIVVCGTGTAGTVAAGRAAEMGANVICLEKLSNVGGTSRFAEGYAAVNSQCSANLDVHFDETATYNLAMGEMDWGCLPAALTTWVTKSGSAVDWIDEKGVEVFQPNPLDAMYNPGKIGYAHCAHHNGEYTSLGEGIIDPLWEYIDSTGNVDLRLNTSMKDLVVEDSKVVGVLAEADDGSIIKINAGSVILATGGFISNDEMLEKYIGVPAERILWWGYEGRDGDGINAALKLGATMHADSVLMNAPGGVANTTSKFDVLNAVVGFENHVTVNAEGKRFYPETITRTNSLARVNALLNEEAAYAILDDTFVQEKEALGNFEWRCGITEGDLLENIDSNPDCYVADTLEELAGFIGANPSTLKETIDNFNTYASDGNDPEFGADCATLPAVKQAPFYAIRMKAAAFATLGGIATDGDTRALTADYETIPGLYIAGVDNGSIYTRQYPNKLGGLGQGWCITSGFVAGETACKDLGIA